MMATKAANKTTVTDGSVEAFLAGIADPQKQQDCRTVAAIMAKATSEEPRMWGPSMVGFGQYHYVYESGREGDWFVTGFAPRAANLTLYIMDGFPKYAELLAKLGKHTTGKSCLYIKRLSDIDLKVLEQLITASVKHVGKK
jgi:hypothetical protein